MFAYVTGPLSSVFLRIQSECGKTRSRKTPNMDIFYAVLHVTIELMKLNGIKFNSKHITIEEVKIKSTSFLHWAYLHQHN